MRLMRWRLAALLLVTAATGRAQSAGEALASVRERLDPASFQAVSALVDSARAADLPTATLVSKVQEGLLKRAAPATIVTVTRGLLGRLRAARAILGPTAQGSELEAAATALGAGASPTQLGALQAARGGRGMIIPLVVLADLLGRGVPRDTAARAVQLLSEAAATDAAFQALRSSIERDIRNGMSPAAATSYRSRAAVQGGRP